MTKPKRFPFLDSEDYESRAEEVIEVKSGILVSVDEVHRVLERILNLHRHLVVVHHNKIRKRSGAVQRRGD